MTLARKRDLGKISQRLKAAEKEIIANVVKKVEEDIDQKYKEVIDMFYDDYEPTAYERWGGLRRAGEVTTTYDDYPNSDAEVKLNLDGNRIIGPAPGFGKDIYNIPPRNVPIGADHIFSDAFESGYHGHAEMLTVYGSQGTEHQEPIPPMSPTPKEILDDYVEDYQKNYRTILKDVIASECEKAIRKCLR